MAFSGQQTFIKINGGFETTNATQSTAYSFTLPQDGTYSLTVTMNARDNVSGRSIKGVKTTTFERIAGVTTQVATSLIDTVATLVSDAVNNAGATWTIDNSGDVIRIRVTGNLGRTLHWQFNGEISMN